jgi:hypothetical protein
MTRFLVIVLALITVNASGGFSQDSLNLKTIGACLTPGRAYGIAVAGDYAYVADDTSGLQVIDITIPSNPVIVGYCKPPGAARGVVIKGNYAYVANYPAGLNIIDISNPTTPIATGHCHGGGFSKNLAVVDSYAYMADDLLRIVDISDPSHPVQVSYMNTPGVPADVAIDDHYAYVADGAWGLRVIDISNPVSPVEVGYCEGFIPLSVAVRGGYAYISNTAALIIIDIADPSNPVIVGTSNLLGSGCIWDVTVVGIYAYVADGASGVVVCDVSIPTSPFVVGYYSTSWPGYARGVDVSGGYIYVADSELGFHIYKGYGPAGVAVIPGNKTKPWSEADRIRICGNTVVFTLNTTSHTSIKIYNLLGQPVRTLVNKVKDAGCYTEKWDGCTDDHRKVSSGVDLVNLETSYSEAVAKMIVVR